MFSPYKKQKKHTPLSKEALKRFDNEIPQHKRDWYKARAHAPDEEEADADAPAAEPEPVADPEAEVESHPHVGHPGAMWNQSPSVNERLRPAGEIPDRLNYAEEGADEIEQKSSPKMTELRARVLAEAKAKQRTVEQRRSAADFRVAHREAVKAMRNESAVKWESDHSGGKRRKLPIIGLWEMLGILAVVLIGVVLISRFSSREKSAVSKTSLEAKTVLPAAPDESAETVLKNFHQATSVEEMLPFVRKPAKVEASMREWHAAHPIQPDTFEVLSSLEGIVSTGAINAPDQMWVIALTVQLANDAAPGTHLIERTEQGFKVDWESSARVTEEKLGLFMGRRSTTPEDFRVTVAPDDYYNFQFSDKEKWVCFRMADKSGNQSLYGYAARGSQTQAKLSDWFYPGETSIPVILTLRFPPESKEGSVEIVDAVQKNWIMRYP